MVHPIQVLTLALHLLETRAPLPVELEDDRLLAQAPNHLPQPLVDHRLLAHTQLITDSGQAAPLHQGVQCQQVIALKIYPVGLIRNGLPLQQPPVPQVLQDIIQLAHIQFGVSGHLVHRHPFMEFHTHLYTCEYPEVPRFQ